MIGKSLDGLSYALITPARNEQDNIRKTLDSVISQTIPPIKWIIVSDGSTDKTDAIVTEYTLEHSWITLLRLPEQRDRSFAAKVSAFNAGYELLKNANYHIIGNLDADISFDPEYIQFLMEKFAIDKQLGVAGTPFVEETGYSSSSDSYEGGTHVAGGCQLFRRDCFEEIGGYIPVKGGGIDWIAVTTARMRGWKTRSFQDMHFYHHRSLGTAERHGLWATFDYGKKDYYLGGHPIWELFRCLYRAKKNPYILGGGMLFSGYIWAMITRIDRPVSRELMHFHRGEQLEKLGIILKSALRGKKIDKYSKNGQSAE